MFKLPASLVPKPPPLRPMVSKPLKPDSALDQAIQERAEVIANGGIDTYKRIRQIGVEISWMAHAFNVPPADKLKLAAYVKELESLLVSLGVSGDELYMHESSHHPPSVRTEEKADELLPKLRAGEISLDILHRKELIAVAWALGASEVDTRGKPIRELREIIKSRMDGPGPMLVKHPTATTTPTIRTLVTVPTNVPIGQLAKLLHKPVIGSPTITPFRAPRRLT